MDLYPTAETWTPGAIAPADGNVASAVAPASVPASGRQGPDADAHLLDDSARHQDGGATTAPDLGANNERLEDLKPKLVHALRELVRQYREEGVVARRHEIRRIRQARLFWQGLQYAWWNPNDMNWHLPFEQRFSDDRALEEMPRYQFVTNFYQGFGLSFIAVLSQDVPSVRFYPQSAQSLEDISAARAASDVATLIEQNNHIEHLLTSIGYFLWTDGKLGAYVRYVADGQRFGFHEENVLEALEIPLGEDVYICPQCGKETGLVTEAESDGEQSASGKYEDGDSPVVGAPAAPPQPSCACAPTTTELLLRRGTRRRESSQGRARHRAAHRRHAPLAQRPGSHLHRRRPRAEYSRLGQRDARISVPAMAGGSASREIESGASARGGQNRSVAVARR
jgi:hypothetical protein